MTAIEDRADIQIEADTRPPVIEISNVWKLHKLGDEVVKALVAADLTVMPGEFVCLMGPSGSGKSTLLNMIGGLDRPTKGKVSVAGRDTSTLTESQFAALRHDTIGFIPVGGRERRTATDIRALRPEVAAQEGVGTSRARRPRSPGRPPADEDVRRRTATHRYRAVPDQQSHPGPGR